MTTFIIFFVIAFIFFSFLGAIVKPIIEFIYYSIIDLLMSLGLSYFAARAVVSLLIIIAIINFIF